MKYIIIISFFLILPKFTFCQELLRDIIERVSNSDYIFEGTVVAQKSFIDSTGRGIYTSNLIQTSKILKGNIKCGTIEIVTRGGRIGNFESNVSHFVSFNADDDGIFMCNKSLYPYADSSIFVTNNNLILDAHYNTQSYIRYIHQYQNTTARDWQFTLDSIAQLYNLMELYSQLNFIDCNEDTSGMNIQNSGLGHFCIQHNKSSGTDTLNIRITNPLITGYSTKYLDFDIEIKDNLTDTSFLCVAFLVLETSGLQFANYTDDTINNVIVYKEDLLLNSTTYLPFTITQNSNTIININCQSNYTGVLSEIKDQFRKLYHVRLKIINCSPPFKVGIRPDQISVYYESTQQRIPGTTNFCQYYDVIDTSGIVLYDSCNTIPLSGQIQNFYPSYITAGTKSVLTITGNGFGNIAGSVYYTEVNQGGASFIKGSIKDTISWSDTLIKVFMSSYTPTIPENSAGTGLIQIKKSNNDIITSTDTLHVQYAVRNIPLLNDIIIPVLAKVSAGSDGYIFRPDTSVFNNYEMYNCVIQALNDWVCATGVNYTIGPPVAGSTASVNDSINLSTVSNFFNNTRFMQTTVTPFIVNNGLDSFAQVEDIDIEINKYFLNKHQYEINKLVNIDFNKYDFYHFILHEFGHSLLLKHVNEKNSIMFYDQDSGVVASLRAVDIYQDENIFNGGNYVVQTSISEPPHLYPSIIYLECSQQGNFTINLFNNNNFFIGPIPSSDFLTITSKNKNYIIDSYSIFNTIGQQLFFYNTNSSELQLNINQLISGVYFIKIKSGYNIYNLKFVKE